MPFASRRASISASNNLGLSVDRLDSYKTI
jgi:hypothetical protein